MRISPLFCSKYLRRMLINEDFPAPECPTKPTFSPGSIERLRSLKTNSLGVYPKQTFLNSIFEFLTIRGCAFFLSKFCCGMFKIVSALFKSPIAREKSCNEIVACQISSATTRAIPKTKAKSPMEMTPFILKLIMKKSMKVNIIK